MESLTYANKRMTLTWIFVLILIAIFVVVVFCCQCRNARDIEEELTCKLKKQQKLISCLRSENKKDATSIFSLQNPDVSIRFAGTTDPVQIVPPATFVPVLFPSLTKQSGIVYDSSSGGFTPSKSGIYDVTFDVQALSIGPGGPIAEVFAEVFISKSLPTTGSVKYGRTLIAVPHVVSVLYVHAMATSFQIACQANETLYCVIRIFSTASAIVPSFNAGECNVTILKVSN
jgi:hypothetical protein